MEGLKVEGANYDVGRIDCCYSAEDCYNCDYYICEGGDK